MKKRVSYSPDAIKYRSLLEKAFEIFNISEIDQELLFDFMVNNLTKDELSNKYGMNINDLVLKVNNLVNMIKNNADIIEKRERCNMKGI